jgi:hypothetical protein
MRLNVAMTDTLMPYEGPELRPHFVLEQWKLRGSAVAGFIGPCEVKTADLVDWEDRLANDFIRSKQMLHFLGEFFSVSLSEGVLYQRLFMSIAAQEIARASGQKIVRAGDDLYWVDGNAPATESFESWASREGKKLSVSIVTASPVSRLLHVGINIDAEGAPVEAAGLSDLGIGKKGDANTAQDLAMIRELGTRILRAFAAEVEEIEWACAKVRPVV